MGVELGDKVGGWGTLPVGARRMSARGRGAHKGGGEEFECFFYNIFLNICVARLSTDQMEDWTTAESALFEEAMEKYGKGEGFVFNP